MHESSFFHNFLAFFLGRRKRVGGMGITDYLHSLWSIGAFF